MSWVVRTNGLLENGKALECQIILTCLSWPVHSRVAILVLWFPIDGVLKKSYVKFQKILQFKWPPQGSLRKSFTTNYTQNFPCISNLLPFLPEVSTSLLIRTLSCRSLSNRCSVTPWTSQSQASTFLFNLGRTEYFRKSTVHFVKPWLWPSTPPWKPENYFPHCPSLHKKILRTVVNTFHLTLLLSVLLPSFWSLLRDHWQVHSRLPNLISTPVTK